MKIVHKMILGARTRRRQTNVGRESPTRRVRPASVALPAEHGGWGFLLEAILLGTLLGVTLDGALLSLSVLGLFLFRQPFRLALRDRMNRRRSDRTVLAERIGAGYALIALLSFGLVLAGGNRTFLIPLALALPFGLLQLVYDLRNKGRDLVAEVGGAIALGSVCPALTLLGGWRLGASMSLWAILLARTVPSILYVRARLRRDRGEQAKRWQAWMAHAIGILVIAILAGRGLVPWLAVVAITLLLVRSILGLSRHRRRIRTSLLGIHELLYGLLTVLLVVGGILLGL